MIQTRRRFFSLCFALSFVVEGSICGGLAFFKHAQADDIIPGKYIVILKDQEKPAEIAQEHRLKAKKVYQHALKGFSAELNEAELKRLNSDPRVVLVEPDKTVRTQASATQSSATWGLDRIDQRSNILDSSYSYVFSGANVTAYVIDTGIRTDHDEFLSLTSNNSRASVAYDALGGNGQDCNGHGTHVAGTIGGLNYGVAKDVTLRAVRVLDCSGSGSMSGVIAGVDYVAKNRSLPAVANLSLGGGASLALDKAIQGLVESGVTVAVAAGNSNADACNYSPARATNAITVGAATSGDLRASYSNFGDCVDLFAPGSGITSAWYSGKSATNTISGTSMATPHVAGVAALYLEAHPSASPLEVRDSLVSSSTKSVVASSKSRNNHLLHSYEVNEGNLDTTSPTGVAVSRPTDGSSVARNTVFTVEGVASDETQVSSVRFYANGSLLCATSVAPYVCSLKVTRSQTLHLNVVATDSAGNAVSSPYTQVVVK